MKPIENKIFLYAVIISLALHLVILYLKGPGWLRFYENNNIFHKVHTEYTRLMPLSGKVSFDGSLGKEKARLNKAIVSKVASQTAPAEKISTQFTVQKIKLPSDKIEINRKIQAPVMVKGIEDARNPHVASYYRYIMNLLREKVFVLYQNQYETGSVQVEFKVYKNGAIGNIQIIS